MAILPKVTMYKSFGNIPLLYRFCQKLDLPQLIDEICPPRHQSQDPCSIGEIITALVINRLTGPDPLYKIEEWAEKFSFDFYFPCSAKELNDDRLSRILDHIAPYWMAIQSHVVTHWIKMFQLDPTILHYDITSIYFEGIYEDVDFIKYGYSRDQKPDKKQINLRLNMIDREPFPVLWQPIAGNQQDTTTVIQNLKELQQRFTGIKLVQVGDRAMFSEEIYEYAINLDITVIVPLKDSPTTQELLSSIDISDLNTIIYETDQKTVKYRLGEQLILIKKDSPLPPLRAIVVWSRMKVQAAARSREKKIKRRRQQLLKLQQKLNKPYYRKYLSIEKKLKKIMGVDPINEGFLVVLTEEEGVLTLSIHEEPGVWEAAAKRDGFYILATTDFKSEFQTEEIFHLYKRQYLVEQAFKTIKSTLKIRPIFVHIPERISGLVHITMLALSIHSLLEMVIRRNQLSLSVKRLLELLSGYFLVQFLLPDQSLHLQIAPLPQEEQTLIRALELESTEDWLLQQVHKRYQLNNKLNTKNK